jgi:hypothetical protein
MIGFDTMTPAAQAVLDAFNSVPYYPDENDEGMLAAALRAAADQLREAYANEEYVDSADDWLDDIAAELDGVITTSGNTQ